MVDLGGSGGISNRVSRQACIKKDCEMGLGQV